MLIIVYNFKFKEFCYTNVDIEYVKLAWVQSSFVGPKLRIYIRDEILWKNYNLTSLIFKWFKHVRLPNGTNFNWWSKNSTKRSVMSISEPSQAIRTLENWTIKSV